MKSSFVPVRQCVAKTKTVQPDINATKPPVGLVDSDVDNE